MTYFKTEHRRALSMLLVVLLVLSMMAITTLAPINVSAAANDLSGDSITVNSNNTMSVQRGSSSTVSVVVQKNGKVLTGDDMDINDLACVDLTGDDLSPDSITFSAAKGTGENESAKLTVRVASTVAVGAYTFTVKYTDNGSTITQKVTLNVTSSSGGGGGAGGGGGGSSSSVNNPTTSGGTTTVNVNVSSTTSGTKASATINSTTMNKAVQSAIAEATKQGTNPVVEIQVSVSAKATALNVTLPTSSLKTLANASGSVLRISSTIVSIELDHDALVALVGAATGSNITLEFAPVAAENLSAAQKDAVGDNTVVDITLKSDGVAIHDFGNGVISISLPYTLPEGVAAADVAVYYLADSGNLSSCATTYANGEVTFITEHLSMYVIGTKGEGNKFVDVDENAYYYDAVMWAVKNGVTTGMTDTTFEPNSGCTRAQFVTFLWRAYGKPEATSTVSFSDIDVNEYYYDALLWAVANGITTGTGDGTTFSPNQVCTRGEAVTFMYRAAGKPAMAQARTFDDVPAGEFFTDAVNWAVSQGITNGNSTTENTFGPYDTCTRGQLVTFLYRELG